MQVVPPSSIAQSVNSLTFYAWASGPRGEERHPRTSKQVGDMEWGSPGHGVTRQRRRAGDRGIRTASADRPELSLMRGPLRPRLVPIEECRP